MTLAEQLRAYIAPDDNYEDRDTIRDLMIAGAERIEALEAALQDAELDAARWRYFREHRTYGWVLEASPEAADAYADKQVEWDREHKAGQFYDGSRDNWPSQSPAQGKEP